MINSWTAVARGAVMKGLSQLNDDDTTMVQSRKAYYAMGTSMSTPYQPDQHRSEYKSVSRLPTNAIDKTNGSLDIGMHMKARICVATAALFFFSG
jgi:hypothetical protein